VFSWGKILPNVQDEPWRCEAPPLALAIGWALSSSDQITKLILDVGENLAIAIAAMLAQPRDDSLNIELLAFEKRCRETKAVITILG
jgi:hypothetical protein